MVSLASIKMGSKYDDKTNTISKGLTFQIKTSFLKNTK